MDTTVLILIIVVALLVIAIGAVGIPFARRKRSERLREQFGPEYERTVAETGNRKAAEADLRDRQRRHHSLEIRDLSPAEHEQFQRSWDSLQRGFVDDPARALEDADQLITEIMRVRGYPVDDFDRRAEHLSVDHPDTVRHYRDARVARDADGGVNTEKQRRAFTSYRAVVDALVPSDTTPSDTTPSDTTQVEGSEPTVTDPDHRAEGVRPSEERTP